MIIVCLYNNISNNNYIISIYIVYEEAVTDTYLFHFLMGMLFLIYALHFRNRIRTHKSHLYYLLFFGCDAM